MHISFLRLWIFVFGLGFLGLLMAPVALWAAPEEYGLSNAPLVPAEPQEETLIILPDGRRVNPWLVVPEGWIVSDDGSLITDEGVIIHRNGQFEYPFGSLPEGYTERPDGSLVLPSGIVVPKPSHGALATRPTSRVQEEKKEAKAEKPQDLGKPQETSLKPPVRQETVRPQQPVLQERPSPQRPAQVRPVEEVPVREVPVREGPAQLWSMLPLSEVPGKPRAENPAREKPKPQASSEKPKEKPKEKPEARRQEKPQAKPEEKPKPQTPRQARRPKVGEELQIPKESAKTGNLDFLEGCWQGTRPEYYSKRTIYECFCFGQHGKNGKRRVIDPQGKRRCVGGTQARLSGNGILHVRSQGAVCSDGERWGQAEMTCRGKGQHTPCSWVFRDANGGQQSYEIPFVRVEQCGRR
ncbi:MAG: hypothetical protein K6G15_09000 [Desulfovibrio sp.]|nr:hypothetical protein [Desulfovibrio sp.]